MNGFVGPKVAITVMIGSVGNARVFVEINAAGELLSREQAEARARAALAELMAAAGVAAPAQDLRASADSDPGALYRSWALR